MVEELLHPDGPVLPIRPLPYPVGLAVVVDHPYGLLQPPQGHEQLDPLVPGHGPVLVVVHHEEGRLDLVRLEEGRVVDVAEGLLPEGPPDSALRVLVLELAVHSAVPPDSTVCAGHVGYRGTGLNRREEVRPRNHVRELVPAPGVTLGPDAVLIDVSLVHDLQDPGNHCIDGAFPGMADLIGNVGNEEHVTPAHVEAVVHRVRREWAPDSRGGRRSSVS